MSVGILILGHAGIGPALLGTAALLTERDPAHVKLLSAARDSDPDELLMQVRSLIEELDGGDGVLVLVDMAGSTPANVLGAIAASAPVRIVAGLNLSMLINVMNYPDAGLDALAQHALRGGRDGVVAVSGS